MNDPIVEIISLADGTELWRERYQFSRLYSQGDVFMKDCVTHTVISCRREGDEIRTIVRIEK